MAYAAGYVARSAPDDARPALVTDSEDGPLRNLWVRLRTQHSLTLPWDEMWRLLCEMETAFIVHHHREPTGPVQECARFAFML